MELAPPGGFYRLHHDLAVERLALAPGMTGLAGQRFLGRLPLRA